MNSNISILIVDDTPEHIKIASSILKKLNYPIRIALNGLDALDLIKKYKPTIVLLDVKMPNMDGFEVCKRIKSNPNYSDIAVIFITSSEDEESIHKAFEVGGQDYVIKPYNASEVISRVSTHINLAVQTINLKKSYEELNQFCHTVSHDLKSPILVLKQLVDILSDEIKDIKNEDVNQIIEQINIKSDNVIEMIDSLLDFSRMSHREINYSKIDLNILINKQLTELISLEKNRSIKYTLSNLPVINGDKTLIKLLYQNILNNALKFTKNNKETLIDIKYEADPQYDIISIKDNGVGFDMEYSNKLFNIFERLHTKEEFPGTGVGLAIVKKIIERHGGKVTISSQLNKGTEVKTFFKK